MKLKRKKYNKDKKDGKKSKFKLWFNSKWVNEAELLHLLSSDLNQMNRAGD